MAQYKSNEKVGVGVKLKRAGDVVTGSDF